nr:hypothetical protein [Tanacetum cinerariifolium]
MATVNEPSLIGTSSGSGPRRQETMGDAAAQTKSERVSKFYNDPPLSKVNILGTIVVKEVDAAKDQVSAATTTAAKYLTVNDTTMSKALEALKALKPKIRGIVVRDHEEPSKSKTTTTPTLVVDSTRPKAKSIVMQEPSEATTTTIIIPTQVKEKGKGKCQLKNKFFDEVQKVFDKNMSWINSFVPMESEVVKDRAKGNEIRVEESSKRAGEGLQQEFTKKQKVDDDQEVAKLKRCLEIVLDDEDDVTIDATPLSSKSPTITDNKIHKEGKKSYFQIIRADGSSQMYYTFSKMLRNFNKEDLEVLRSIVKARFKKVQPVDYMDCY